MTGNELITGLFCGFKTLAQYHFGITYMQLQATATLTNCLREDAQKEALKIQTARSF
jgi:hypothetical protein